MVTPPKAGSVTDPREVQDPTEALCGWRHYADSELAPLCRSGSGAITADYGLAPYCRSVTTLHDHFIRLQGRTPIRQGPAVFLEAAKLTTLYRESQCTLG